MFVWGKREGIDGNINDENNLQKTEQLIIINFISKTFKLLFYAKKCENNMMTDEKKFNTHTSDYLTS